jgi:dTDP-4-amino-4,6-dideoxygalactose transaminase
VIPLFNPRFETLNCNLGIAKAFNRVCNSGNYVNGPETRSFEVALARYFNTAFAAGVSSGTAALEFILRADQIGRQDTVVTTSHTFVAVLEAILIVGAEPVLVDIDPDTWQMPIGNWENEVVIVGHLYGGASPAVKSRARILYEDVSQSFGSRLDNKLLGTFGRAAALSLYPTKNLSALGDAGAVISRNEHLVSRVRAIRNHGQTQTQVHTFTGTTGRLDEVQAAILAEKLKCFDRFSASRREAAQFYCDHLEDLPLRFRERQPGSSEVPNMFVVRTDERAHLQRFLYERGVSTGIHYPTPFHLMPAYRNRSWAQVELPQTERLCNEILSLPLWSGITITDLRAVVNALREYFGTTGRA